MEFFTRFLALKCTVPNIRYEKISLIIFQSTWLKFYISKNVCNLLLVLDKHNTVEAV